MKQLTTRQKEQKKVRRAFLRGFRVGVKEGLENGFSRADKWYQELREQDKRESIKDKQWQF